MKKNTVKLNICSQNLTIVSDESPEYIRKIADELTQKIDAMVNVNRYRPVVSAILLCAMQYCDDNFKLNEEIASLKKENELLFEKLKKAQTAKTVSNSKKNIDNAATKTDQNNAHLEIKMKQQSLFDKEEQNSPTQISGSSKTPNSAVSASNNKRTLNKK